MKETDGMLETVLAQELEQHKTGVDFHKVWNEHQRHRNKAKGLKKTFLYPAIAVLSFLLVFTGGFAAARVFNTPIRTDKTDYPFVQDDAVIGKWEVVDFVDKIEGFNPKQVFSETRLYLNALVFLPDGTMLSAVNDSPLALSEFVWTKDLVISEKNQTASQYRLQEIDGEKYMFFEWKSGDYMFRNMEPRYYVLKQTNTDDYSEWSSQKREDETDYPFAEDPQILGKWETVDYVDTIDRFNPKRKRDNTIHFLIGMEIERNGKLIHQTISGELSSEEITWTKGLILNRSIKTASSYEIREMDGSTYLFYEWKSGDYIFHGMDPKYYVLKKIDR